MALLKESNRAVASVPAGELESWLDSNHYPIDHFDIEFQTNEMSDISLETAIQNGWLDIAWHHIRTDRDRLLANCDYTQMPDTPLTAAQKQTWADYRQALRDLPNNNDDPALVVWPTPPQEQ